MEPSRKELPVTYNKWTRRGSNPGPSLYESAALHAELRVRHQCPGRDSNPRRRGCRPLALPLSYPGEIQRRRWDSNPQALAGSCFPNRWGCQFSYASNKTEERDLNPRPARWRRAALAGLSYPRKDPWGTGGHGIRASNPGRLGRRFHPRSSRDLTPPGVMRTCRGTGGNGEPVARRSPGDAWCFRYERSNRHLSPPTRNSGRGI